MKDNVMYDNTNAPTRRRATDPTTLIPSLPTDAAGFRSLCANLEQLEDEVGAHLDAFSGAAFGQGAELDRDALISLFRRRRRDLELAVLVLSTRLSAAPLRSLYAGGLLATLCDDALGRRRSRTLTQLLTRLAERTPEGWQRVVASFEALTESNHRWRRWPAPPLARAAVDALEAVEPTWREVVSELRRELSGGINRERRRDPAFRRAVNWHAMTLGLFRRLTGPGGPQRIIIDYCFAVIAYFDSAVVNAPQHGAANRAASDLLVLEVFGMLEQFSLADDEIETSPPRFLEQGETNRRKRIQRARLQVLMRWKLLIDDDAWVEWVYPSLDRIARGREQMRLEPDATPRVQEAVKIGQFRDSAATVEAPLPSVEPTFGH
ncbi:hypothetical protein ENSA5_31610 [Enhygromyxa salina]|uniref:Uncharacterized protein n=1 Tax=Enhygromyxa salina TaxID=215803 RepID=A0A2S9XXT7_9BACT|nr:hypothetical protein [Enhygromyxa salina]PRP97654.1 hypothetical protein ENSA5_31610 [Enhygromyxa salina]